jgi:hypothetical protein
MAGLFGGAPWCFQLGRHRYQTLMTGLAISDEHPLVRRLQILQPQLDHLVTTHPAEHHRFDHRPVPPPANRAQQKTTSPGSNTRGNVRSVRINGDPIG